MDRRAMYPQGDIMDASENFLAFHEIFRQKIISGYRPSLDIKPALPFSSLTITMMKILIQSCWDPEFANRPRFDQITAIFTRLHDR